MRFTKIIATIGPATSSPKTLRMLADSGVNVFRLNFSHGNHEAHGQVIKNIRDLNKEGEYSIGIMLDTKGPEVRTGDVKEAIIIKKGDKVMFTPHPVGNEKMKVVKVDYEKFADDVRNASSILLDNGAIEFKAVTIGKKHVIAKALEDGKIGSRRHINLPGAHISLPSFTEKDWDDIAFGVEQNVDFIATSFVRTGKDIHKLKEFLRKNGSPAEIVAKIETPQAVDNIDDIIDESDGIMVARGDLGAEVPFEDVPRIQDMIVSKCRLAGKPVIIATHMLESMILCPMPTRAEVTDISHAAITQADCTMLSGETASGLYPFKAVSTMQRVLVTSERVQPVGLPVYAKSPVRDEVEEQRREQAVSASVLAQNLKADAIVIITKHGLTAKAVSNCRPLVPIYAFTADESVQRRLSYVWGVQASVIKLSDHPENTVVSALSQLKKTGVLKKGTRVVVVSDILTGGTHIMTVQIRHVS